MDVDEVHRPLLVFDNYPWHSAMFIVVHQLLAFDAIKHWPTQNFDGIQQSWSKLAVGRPSLPYIGACSVRLTNLVSLLNVL